ncbi:hypothetical protein M4578_16910 [Salipiger sp. P9]|uniref:hypothetical protein n=1 Tax=Salipiger pentaromativorans TaxID=2943193 RepID=UPI0021570517|nr:hypothetical protein [Salipiger pentaromativorans]MCR8549513.1 hypothetical protein [Salipiger pentaromativorans]
MTDDIGALLRVTALLRERALESYRRDLMEELRLQDEQRRIDAMRHGAFADRESLDARRLIGADTLWQGWLARRRGEINRDIALSRARQAHSIAHARRAFARDEAAREVAQREALARRQARLAEEEARLEDLSRLAGYDAGQEEP